MARIIFSESFLIQSELFVLIKEKVEADGPASPLLAYLTEQGIVLADDDTDRQAAEVFEKNRKKLARESENFRQLRDNYFNPVMERVRGYYQFLKKFYRGTVSTIGLWGAPVTTTGRIAYPAEFVQLTDMVITLIEKYDTYPVGTSPLDPYLTQHSYSIATDQSETTDALTKNSQADASANASEDATQDRNNIWNPVLDHMRGIGAFLMALYRDNPKELGSYGFIVDDSPRAPKQVVSKVKLLDQITVSSVVIGGTFKNIGSVPLTVYKGSTTSPAGTIVPAGEMLGITKGYSTITVANPSSTTTGVFSALRHK